MNTVLKKSRALELDKTDQSQNEVPELDSIKLRRSGKVHNMDWWRAKLHCEKNESRLPTARELAQLAVKYGAEGIRETKFPRTDFDTDDVHEEIEEMRGNGFHPVYCAYHNEIPCVEFYFSNKGYSRPEGEKGDYSIVSNSHSNGVPPEYGTRTYVFNFHSGTFGIASHGGVDFERQAVRCIKK